jgi:DNA ligase-1
MPAVLLATDAPADIEPAGYLVSEKYDGVRALWDGTQLRFRSGRVIAAPAWFLAKLPPQPLDGELWLARGRFELLSGIVRKAVANDDEWHSLRYMVFELPGAPGTYAERASQIVRLVDAVAWPALMAAEQRPINDREALVARLDAVVRSGGEGLVLHRADAPYQTGRSGTLLKLKPFDDAEAVVVAYVPGHGKYAGQLGALRVRTTPGASLLIGTGFSDAERAAPPPLGSTVTYTHRGLTRTGVPRFASFLRRHDAF